MSSGIMNPQFFMGVIEEIVDPRKEGRVKVRAFNIHGTIEEIPTENLPWAIVCWGGYDPNFHLYLNDWVFGVFIDGPEAQQPMVLGLIPTQTTRVIDPDADGYGALPLNDFENQMGPNEFGQPRNSKTHRGEYLNETYIGDMDKLRVKGIQGAQGTDEWEEPGPYAKPEYPYNRVIETAKHRIEIDDSEGNERITIHHNSGSYIEIGDRGTTKHKSIHDKYEINDENQYVYIGGTSNVVIKGNAYVKVEGNKTEEVMGDYTQLIHGDHMMSVGGESSINAATTANVRAASVKIHANANDISMMAEENLIMEATDTVSRKSNVIWDDAEVNWAAEAGTFFVKSTVGTQIKTSGFTNIQSDVTMDLKSPSTRLEGTNTLDLSGALTKLGGSGLTHIRGSTVNIDDFVSMANGAASLPNIAAPASYIAPALFDPGVNKESGIPQLPEPVPYAKALNIPDRPPLREDALGSVDHADDGDFGDTAVFYVEEGAFANGEKYWTVMNRDTGLIAKDGDIDVPPFRSRTDAQRKADELNGVSVG